MKISGQSALKRKLATIPKAARAEIRTALEKSAQEIVANARSFAPVDKGDLKASIGYTFGEVKLANANVRGVVSAGSGDKDLSVTIHAGDARAYYAAFVEFGTQKASAQPFLFPAYRLGKKRAKSRISRAINTATKAIAGSGT